VTQAYVDAADATKVSKAGDTMTGLLVLSANPTAALGAVTKQYTDARTPQITVSTTAPSSPAVNDIWIDIT
jgi:hypothetical protein